MPILPQHEGISFSTVLPNIDGLNCNLKEKFLWNRSFVITYREYNFLYDFKYNKIDNIYIYYKNIEFSRYDINNCTIIILGLAYYIDEHMFKFDIIKTMCEKLSNSYKEFYKFINFIGGRYVIIYKKENNINIINDAHGLKSIFYHSKTGMCSSHIELLNLIVNENENDLLNYKKTGYSFSYELPGNNTIYKNIYFLPSNFYFNFESKIKTRFWPIENRKYGSIYEARTNILRKYYLQLYNLNNKYRLLMSLTGGKDSRVSFYSSNNLMKKIFYYTEGRDNDISEVEKIVKKYNIKWIGFDPKDIHIINNDNYVDFMEILKKHAYPKTVLYALRCQFLVANIFGIDKFLHIHSNCAETGRGYLWYNYSKNDFSFENYYNGYIEKAVSWKDENTQKKFMEKMKKDENLRSALYIHYNELGLENISHLGYNPWNLLYMEHRCSNFLSGIHVLNDIAFDSISLTNTRDILMDFWSIDDELINGSYIIYNSILKELDTYQYSDKYNYFNYFDDKCIYNSNEKDLIYAGSAIMDYYFNAKIFEDVINLSNKILKLDCQHVDAYKYSIKSYIKINDTYNINKYCLMCIENVNNINEDMYFLEEACNYFRKYKSTVNYVDNIINKIIIKNDKIFWAYKQKAYIYYNNGDIENSIKYIQKSILLKNNDRWNNEFYIKLLYKHISKQDAIDEVTKIKKLGYNYKWIDSILEQIQTNN